MKEIDKILFKWSDVFSLWLSALIIYTVSLENFWIGVAFLFIALHDFKVKISERSHKWQIDQLLKMHEKNSELITRILITQGKMLKLL